MGGKEGGEGERSPEKEDKEVERRRWSDAGPEGRGEMREKEGRGKGKMEDKEDFCLVEKKKKRPKENRGP